MEKTNYPLCCYSNGEIVVEGENVSYKDGEPFFVFVNSNHNFDELTSLICEELEVNRSEFGLDIKMKYPNARGYKVLSLNNDKSLKALWASVYQMNASSMDLYISLIPIQQPRNLFTNMLNQAMRGENPLFSAPFSSNSVDQEQYDLNSNDDEIDEDEDELLMNESDDECEDLVTPSAPTIELSRVPSIDLEYVNRWCGKVDVPCYDGGEFLVGQRFNNKLGLSQYVRQYHIERNQTFKTTESKPLTVTFKCSRKPSPCDWTLRASNKEASNDSFTIVTYKGPHNTSCVVDAPPLDHPNLSNGFIAKHIRTVVDADWGVKISNLRANILTQFNFEPSYMKTWHAKQKAMADLYGDWKGSYALLPRYLQALKTTNPGTVVKFAYKVGGPSNVRVFDRVFWAFGPSIRGFEHCRPILTVDGTHLYGKYKGVLLIAIGVDANDQIYPLAFAIVDCESIDTWGWFMDCIRKHVTQREGICVISDRHVGIMTAMSKVGDGWTEPQAFHRFCTRYQASNINTKFKSNELKLAFLSTACAAQRKRFNKGMQKIGSINPSAKVLLESIPLSKWSLCHDGGHRYGIKTTNNSECFNGVLKRVRFLPITALVKATFFRINSYFVKHREDANKRLLEGCMWSEKVTEKLAENVKRAAHHKVTCYDARRGLYEVVTGRGNRLGSEVCRANSISSDQYVDPFYSSGEYHGSYRSSFHPVPDESYWMPWMDPGPDDGKILHLQSTHRSQAIWEGEELKPLTLRGHMKAFKAFKVPEAVLTYVNNTQFRGITRFCYVPLDADLITALVERWRQETHTFHLPFGEATVTLQDVAMLFGLRISGRPVTGSSEGGWLNLCVRLLGATPSIKAIKGSKLKLTWLHDNFQNVANINSQYQLHCHVRAYLLYLFGALLFPDKSGSTVSLIYLPLLENLDQIDDISWGSGVLACLYRNLCKATKVDCFEIAGPLLLLQLWSWERVSIGRPDIVRSRVPRQAGVAYPLGSQVLTGLDPLGCKWLRVQRGFKDHRLGLVVIRDLLDKMVELQFVWQPYTPSVVQHLSPICVQDQAEWTVISPLICFEMVEWHFPNRCTRQFGWQQMIPEMGNTCTRLQGISRKGDWSGNYETMHQVSIAKWENRMSNIVEPGLPFCGLMNFEDEYFEWYNAITRRIITPLSQTVNDDYEDHHYYYPTAADFQILTQTSMVTYNTTQEMISNMPDDIPLAQYAMIEKMRNMSLNSLVNTGQGHLINYQEPRPPSPPRYDFRHLAHRQQVMTQETEEAESSQRTRKKGKKRN
ncbi:hypothetical protein KSS87_014112 [Heliosperma pusillum]|nr:hypothetical protein KSS87_014112 [Heliosperma pusillum]